MAISAERPVLLVVTRHRPRSNQNADELVFAAGGFSELAPRHARTIMRRDRVRRAGYAACCPGGDRSHDEDT